MSLLIGVNLALFALSFLSGMLGLGVAFVAIPALGLFGFELKHVIMPWALWLNGLTAISAAATYMRKKMVECWAAAQFDPWLVATTSVTATVGAQLGALFMAQRVKSVVLKRAFAALLVALAVQRIVALVS